MSKITICIDSDDSNSISTITQTKNEIIIKIGDALINEFSIGSSDGNIKAGTLSLSDIDKISLRRASIANI